MNPCVGQYQIYRVPEAFWLLSAYRRLTHNRGASIIQSAYMESKQTFIYVLTEPEDIYDIRYVGKTNDLGARFDSHIKDNKKGSYKRNWIASLKGKQPGLGILEILINCSDKEWMQCERKWIKTLIEKGCRLTNSDPGGIGNSMSKYTRKKISNTLKGHLVTKETREKLSKCRPSLESRRLMSQRQKARFALGMPQKTRDKLRVISTGRIVTDETRRRLSKALTGKKISDETRERLAFYARNKSLETRAKISKANKGRRITEEQREKLSNSLKGRIVKESTRAKIAIGVAKYHLSVGHKVTMEAAQKRGWSAGKGEWGRSEP